MATSIPPSPPTPPPVTAYEILTRFFHRNRKTVTEISVLPSPLHDSILTSGPNLGFPIKQLISAFRDAHRIFTSTTFSQFDITDSNTQSALLDSTLILLLTGAENTTAINIRKKILLNDTTTTEVVTAELTLLESLLTSPLPKHNKSPTLWQHRRWVVSTFVDIKEQEFRMELSIVQRSTKVHPRNYYAWGYARWITGWYFSCGGLRTQNETWEIFEEHRMFCWVYPSDIGPWMFMIFLMETMMGPLEQNLSNCRDQQVWWVRMVEDSMKFARDIVPGHETIWCFVRIVVGRTQLLPVECRKKLLRMLEGWVEMNSSIASSPEYLNERFRKEMDLEERAMKWIYDFGDVDILVNPASKRRSNRY